MEIISIDRQAKLEFIEISTEKVDGYSADLKMTVVVNGYEFSGMGKDAWFDKNDVADFIKKTEQILDGTLKECQLKAYSEFELHIKPLDSCGHYAISVIIEKLMKNMKLCFALDVEYSDVLSIQSLLKNAIQNP